jgi:hypothetical protein
MISCLQKINPLLQDEINNPVLLRQPARPGTASQVAQRFRLANALGRVTDYQGDF